MRPLIFATLQPELAEAKGVPLRFISTAFLAIVALAVSACAQIVGVLLVFTLMVGPPAAAQRLTTRPVERACARRWPGARRGLARHYDRLLHRLAGELLHRGIERFRLLRRAGGPVCYGCASSIALAAAMNGSGSDTAARSQTSRAGISGASHITRRCTA